MGWRLCTPRINSLQYCARMIGKKPWAPPVKPNPAIFIWFGFCCFFFLLVFFLVFLPALPVFPLLCPLFSLPSPSLFLPIPVHSPFPCPSLLVSLPFLPNFFFFDLSLLLESPYLLLFIFLLLFPSWKLVLFLSFSLFSFLFFWFSLSSLLSSLPPSVSPNSLCLCTSLFHSLSLVLSSVVSAGTLH